VSPRDAASRSCSAVCTVGARESELAPTVGGGTSRAAADRLRPRRLEAEVTRGGIAGRADGEGARDLAVIAATSPRSRRRSRSRMRAAPPPRSAAALATALPEVVGDRARCGAVVDA
jgi:hypothetical protein